MKKLLSTVAILATITSNANALTVNQQASVNVQQPMEYEAASAMDFGNVMRPSSGSATLTVVPGEAPTGTLVHTGGTSVGSGSITGTTGDLFQVSFSNVAQDGMSLSDFVLRYGGVEYAAGGAPITGLAANSNPVSAVHGATLTVDSTATSGAKLLDYNIDLDYQ